MRVWRWLAAAALVLALPAAAAAPPAGVGVRFVEPDPQAPAGPLPCYRPITDRSRLAALDGDLANEPARWALDLYARAQRIAAARGAAPPADYTIAIVPGAGNAAIGFRLHTAAGIEEHPHTAYVELAPEAWRFATTLLHETGHVVLAMLAGGRPIPRREIAAIPHTLAALTDRGTAFDEGFAIALEAVIAFVSDASDVRRQYRHERLVFGPVAGMHAEYFWPLAQLLTYAQEGARFAAVRDDMFAFAPACKEPDYLRVQVETARDLATLRDPDQLLASEGYYASFFFGLLVRGERRATEALVRGRESSLLSTLAEMFATTRLTPDTPYLLDFLATDRRVNPGGWAEALDVLLDLSHDVFADPGAAGLWRRAYLAALALDLPRLDRARLDADRARWRAAVIANPRLLYARVGPQLRCEVAGVRVVLVGLKSDRPLSFDINTAEEGVMRLVPGISKAEVASWQAARSRSPFASVADFRARSGLSPRTLAALTF